MAMGAPREMLVQGKQQRGSDVRRQAVPSGLGAGELRQQGTVRAVTLERVGELHSLISTSNKSICNMGLAVLK